MVLLAIPHSVLVHPQHPLGLGLTPSSLALVELALYARLKWEWSQTVGISMLFKMGRKRQSFSDRRRNAAGKTRNVP